MFPVGCSRWLSCYTIPGAARGYMITLSRFRIFVLDPEGLGCSVAEEREQASSPQEDEEHTRARCEASCDSGSRANRNKSTGTYRHEWHTPKTDKTSRGKLQGGEDVPRHRAIYAENWVRRVLRPATSAAWR